MRVRGIIEGGMANWSIVRLFCTHIIRFILLNGQFMRFLIIFFLKRMYDTVWEIIFSSHQHLISSSMSKEFGKVLKTGTRMLQAWRETLEQPSNMHIAGDLATPFYWFYNLLKLLTTTVSLFAPCTVLYRHGTIQTMGHQGSPHNLQYLSSG